MSTAEFNLSLVSLQGFLEGHARQLVGNADAAKDLTQETFLKALIYKDKFSENTNLKAWLYTIMKHIFINNYRHDTKANTFIDQTEDLYYLNLSSDRYEDNPEAMLHTAELEKAIQCVDCNFREAFDLYNQGFQYKEIAEKLGITIGTVKSRIFYVRKKLMAGLTEYQPN